MMKTVSIAPQAQKARAAQMARQAASPLARRAFWEYLVMAALVIVLPFLAFTNLDVNPRPWHDEGASLSLARTLAEDGVYAMHSAEGYQTFGPVQSVGPTVLVPVALVYRWFGVGLLQGRVVAAVYSLLTLLVFFLAGNELFGRRAALLALLLLISSPAVRYFLYGRQVLGEVPALGFFLAGCLVWAKAVKTRRWALGIPAGLLFGLALVTKSQYLVMVFGSAGLIFLLDLFYYRLGTVRTSIAAGITAAVCLALWHAWQVAYFGAQVYLEDLDKLRQLGAVTTGFHLSGALEGLQSVFGSDTGNFYIFWGLLVLPYFLIESLKKERQNQIMAFLLCATLIWLAFYVLWIIPWHRYAMPAMAMVLFFIARAAERIAEAVQGSWPAARTALLAFVREQQPLPGGAVLAFGSSIALASLALWSGYQLEKIARADVFDREGGSEMTSFTPRQLWAAPQVAGYLQAEIDPAAVVETWERELSVLTDLNYHFPDQSLLAKAHAAVYRGGPTDYQLAKPYFDAVRPDYIVIGFYARFNRIYDLAYVREHFALIKTVGSDGWQYEVYQRVQP